MISVAVCSQFISGILLAIGPMDAAPLNATVSKVMTITLEAVLDAESIVFEIVF